MMDIVCLDLEGVLVPEIWIAFAEASGIPELKRTTRDEPDYDKLMKWRLGILKEHGLGLKEIQATIEKIDPLPGAKEFLDELRSLTQVIIISDTFTQFAKPLMKKLGWPTLFCNSLEVAEDGTITGFKMRIENSKLTTVKALQSAGFDTIAAGDSFNDLGMIKASRAGFLFRTTDQIKKDYPDLLVIADVCLCEYTSHGHCGLIRDGIILNDETLPLLAQTAVSYARAGADIIAPSDMMDKRVGAIRQALDAAGFTYTPIMAYSAKFASGYYGPFRDAAHSAPGFGDRKTYQMDPANGREAMREVEEDIAEGADLIIAKPAMAYMDIITEIRRNYNIPIVAYNVSGEYSMVKAAAANGWIDEKKIVMENLIGMKRAGADMIITYHALDVAEWIQKGEV